MIEFDALEPVDYLRSGAIVLGFLAAGLGTQEAWIHADVLSTLAMGAACLFFPNVLLEFQVSRSTQAK